MTVGLTVSANVGNTVSGVRQVTRVIDDLRRSVQAVNGDLRKLSADDAAVWAALEHNVQQGLQRTPAGRRILPGLQTSTGAQQPTLQQILGTPLSTDPALNAQRHANLLQMLGGGNGINVNAPPGAPHGGAGGGMGGGIARTLGIPTSAGGLAGLGMAVGGIAGLGAIISGIGAESKRAEGLEDWRNTLGASPKVFAELNEQVKDVARGLDVTFDESQKLQRSFSELAMVSDREAIRRGVMVSGQFGRGFGMDPSQSTQAFAGIRFKTGADDKQIAIAIAEAISRSGMVTRSAEVMESFAKTIQQMVNHALVAPRLSDVSTALTAANLTGLPGMMGAGGADLINRASSAIAGGGGRGEASRLFIGASLLNANRGTAIESDPFARQLLMEMGAFGTPSMLKKFGVDGGDSNQTNLSAIMQQFQRSSGGIGRAQQISMVGGLFGMNGPQAAGMLSMMDKYGGVDAASGKLGKLVDATGIDVSQGLTSRGYEQLLQLAESRDEGTYGAANVRQKAQAIVAAEGVQTEGGAVREANANLANEMSKFSGELVNTRTALQELTAAILGGPNIKALQQSPAEAAANPYFMPSIGAAATGNPILALLLASRRQ